MKREKLIPAARWGSYVLLLLLCYTLQTIPGLFAIGHAKPALIAALAVCVAMHENVMPASFFCMAAGLLWDISSGKLFGFNAVILMACGMFISLLCIYYLHTKWINALFLGLGALLLQGGLDYLFYYAIWGYGNSWMIFVQRTLPMIAYTLVSILPIFWLVRRIAHRLSTEERG